MSVIWMTFNPWIMALKASSTVLRYRRQRWCSAWKMDSAPFFPKSLFTLHSLTLLQVGLLGAAIKDKILLIGCIYGPFPSSHQFQTQKTNGVSRSLLVPEAGKAELSPATDGKLLQIKLFFFYKNGNWKASFSKMLAGILARSHGIRAKKPAGP